MFKRGAIELSLNFIVIIIISIVIFGFGVVFISNLSRQANEIQGITTKELDERLGSLVCEGSERVCIGTDRKTITKTKFDIFGLKIINILDSQDFTINVAPSQGLLGYATDKIPIRGSADFKGLVVNPENRAVFIEKNEDKTIGIGIQVPANAVAGTYILNIRIRSSDGSPYVPIQKLLVDVP